LNFGNATLVDTFLLVKSVINAADRPRVVYSVSSYGSITRILTQLHWLKVQEWIELAE